MNHVFQLLRLLLLQEEPDRSGIVTGPCGEVKAERDIFVGSKASGVGLSRRSEIAAELGYVWLQQWCVLLYLKQVSLHGSCCHSSLVLVEDVMDI
jgi:hypothetical protein